MPHKELKRYFENVDLPDLDLVGDFIDEQIGLQVLEKLALEIPEVSQEHLELLYPKDPVESVLVEVGGLRSYRR